MSSFFVASAPGVAAGAVDVSEAAGAVEVSLAAGAVEVLSLAAGAVDELSEEPSFELLPQPVRTTLTIAETINRLRIFFIFLFTPPSQVRIAPTSHPCEGIVRKYTIR